MMRVLATTMGLIASEHVWAQAVTVATKFADPDKAASLPVTGAAGVSHVGLAMLVVLMLIFVAAWAMRKFKFSPHRQLSKLEVVQGISLGARERAVIINVQGKRLLLGVAPGQVSLLTELAIEEQASTDAADMNSDQQAPTFKALLKRSMGMS